MRVANVDGRLGLVQDGRFVDVEQASDGRFGPDPMAVLGQWPEFVEWAASATLPEGRAFDDDQADNPVPNPRQIFAIGVNYGDHASEAQMAPPEQLLVFTKFVSSLTGPRAEVELPSEKVDWEVELVVVIGKEAREVPLEDAWDYVAGVTAGQDISERAVQAWGPAPQFSLGKSFPGFGPVGPVLVTTDELPDRDDVGVRTEIVGVDGQIDTVQDGRTSAMIFPVARLVSLLSEIVTLYPGDLIFTGTPAGVGWARTPPRFLRAGETLVSTVEGIGQLRNRMVDKAVR